MSRKKWNILQYDKQLAAELAEECGIDGLVALILTARGVTDPFEAEELLSDDQTMCDPFEMADMETAVERIRAAVDRHEKIAIYGDYDADGLTSTAMLYNYLCSQDADVMHLIPERDEGYGISTAAVDLLKQQQISLIITVDNGITAVDEIEYANKLGIDVVVTDHHLPGEILPPACAVVDPHRADCPSVFKDYSGAGVVYQLICALEGALGEELMPQYGDLAAVGTIADVMPLIGENRLIVRGGVPYVDRARIGLTSLITAAGLNKRRLSASTVSFGIAPRLNAAGRMGHCDRAIGLLLSDDISDADALAAEINDYNLGRQKVEREIFAEACRIIEERGMNYDRVIVVCGIGWHHGVIGIVASRICEQYGRPAVVLSDENGVAVGSARSIAGFSIHDAVFACGELLTRFGGHDQAAGITLEADKVDLFRERINRYAAENYDDMPFAELNIDCRLMPSAFSPDMVRSLEVLEPFGAGNPSPVFGLMNMRIDRITKVSDGRHLRLDVSKNGNSASVMLFGRTFESFGYPIGAAVDIAVSAEVSEYAGREQVTLSAKAVRPSSVDETAFLSDIRLYERLRRGEALNGVQSERCRITRDDVAVLYRFLKRGGGFCGDFEALLSLLDGLSCIQLRLIIDVMCEIGLIECYFSGDSVNISLCPVSGKLELELSPTFSRMNG